MNPGQDGAKAGLRRLAPGAAVLALLAIFALDFVTPLGFAHGTLYIAAILLAAPSRSPRMVLAISAAAAALTVGGAFLSPPGFDWHYAALNRAVSVVLIALLGLLAVLAIRRMEALAAAQTGAEAAIGELRAAQSLVRIAGRTARIGGWSVDLARDRVLWSEETAAIHGLPAGTAPTREEALAYYPPEHRDRIERAFRRCAEHGEPFDERLQIVAAGGRRVWVRAIGEAVRGSDGAIAFVQGAFQDMTDLVESRAQAERLSTRLAETLENISDGFLVLGPDWCVAYANRQALKLLNRDARGLIGKHAWTEFPEAAGSTFQIEYEAAVARGETRSFVEFFPPLGKWFEVRAYPSPDGLAVHFRDVTEDRARQEHLRLLESSIARVNDIVMITEAAPIDEPGPRIVYVNDAFEKRTGFSRSDALGRSPRILQGPLTSRATLDRIKDALRRTMPARAEVINYTKDGRQCWLELDIAPIFDAAGRHTHWVSVERDITLRKAIEASAADMKDRLETLVGHAKIGILVHVDFAPVMANDELARLLGYAGKDEILALADCRGLFADGEQERISAYNRARTGSGAAPGFYEVKGRKRDGTEIVMENRAFPIQWGDRMAVCAMLTDVTEQRHLEEQLRQSQRLDAVGQLTGGVAHDFNNLLTVILGNAEMLSDALADKPKLQGLARMTARAAERGAELTGRLLAFARRQTLDPKPIAVDAAIAGMESLLRRALGEHIDIRLVPAEGLWNAMVDATQLESALLNLCINARDAMPQGGRITIETGNIRLGDDEAAEAGVAPGDFVTIAVADTGSGMHPHVLARAFEPFFTTKEVGKGSGLGLSMVYGFAKQSKGFAKIESERGRGTTVRLYLPRAAAEDRPVAAAADPVPAAGSEKVLVVEDDDLVRESVAQLLEDLGYRVECVANGAEALDALRRAADFDLLFTDVVMPGGMNGRALAEAARQIRADLPVLFTSGYAEDAIAHHGELDPGIQLLAKPYRREDLAAKLRQALRGHAP